ncbi:protein CYCLOPS-like isoform X1 [Lycium ferocissimum]|uniref:protein CYCLOPS-like isoform X1 n=1 Tax=Lycium ferocissimum TaxID=112874 RepID=UPI0028163EDB|nr:protein CYCLOPS-like isoform X1 [Lycium ferocissimum]
MEMEGRGYSDFCRNTSEELFIRTMMENSVGVPVPTMEMLGFRNISHSLRTDSEELFKSWLTSAENNGSDSTPMAHRARQASRRISSELAGLSSEQNGGTQKRKVADTLQPQNTCIAKESSSNLNQHLTRNVTDREMQASNLFLAKTWFHSSQPMTRSRSSELRRRYAAMQNSQSSLAREALHNIPGNSVNNFNEEVADPIGYTDMSMCEINNQPNTFVSPSNSSSSTFETQQVDGADNISSVVSMLKGTLERKKLANYHTAREAIEENMLGYYGNQEVFCNSSINHISENQGTYQDASVVQVRDTGILQTVQGSFNDVLEGIMAPSNPIQMAVVSQEHSRSESSVAAPIISTGFDICDGLSNASQALNVYEGSRNQVGYARSSENGSTARDIRERIYDNVKDNQKTSQKEGLVRNGSLTSVQSAENGDPKKKRRVERSRKMAEAKERNLTPAIPSDMQSLMKRCENLEKEVRSLKLNLAFMNRKDSEQTTQIEELQKQNEDLIKEKERLLEEIERIISESGKF